MTKQMTITKQTVTYLFALLLMFAMPVSAAMASEDVATTGSTGHDAATDDDTAGDTTSENEGDPSGAPGNQGDALQGEDGNAGGDSANDGHTDGVPPVEVGIPKERQPRL